MTRIIRHESVAAYAQGNASPYCHASGGQAWDMGVGPARAAELAVKGDSALVRASEAIIADVTTVCGEADTLVWSPAIAGARVHVPSYIGGNPQCMRRPVRRASESPMHVNVYVELGCFAYYDARVLLSRGAAVLAFIEALQTRRINVDLYLTHHAETTEAAFNYDLMQVVHVESRPLDLSVSGFSIGHPAFIRGVMFHRAREHGYTGRPSAHYPRQTPRCPKYEQFVRGLLGLAPTDVYIPRFCQDDPLASNPREWIARSVSQIAGGAS